jgi:hypothetical protein
VWLFENDGGKFLKKFSTRDVEDAGVLCGKGVSNVSSLQCISAFQMHVATKVNLSILGLIFYFFK